MESLSAMPLRNPMDSWNWPIKVVNEIGLNRQRSRQLTNSMNSIASIYKL
jgi:hypothetical protein